MNENRLKASLAGLLVSLLFAFVSAISAQTLTSTVRKTKAFHSYNNSHSVLINGLTIEQYARTANGPISIELGGNMYQTNPNEGFSGEI